jgi:hypothetical protein
MEASGQHHTWAFYSFGKDPPSTYCVGDRVGLRTSLDASGGEKNLLSLL